MTRKNLKIDAINKTLLWVTIIRGIYDAIAIAKVAVPKSMISRCPRLPAHNRHSSIRPDAATPARINATRCGIIKLKADW